MILFMYLLHRKLYLRYIIQTKFTYNSQVSVQSKNVSKKCCMKTNSTIISYIRVSFIYLCNISGSNDKNMHYVHDARAIIIIYYLCVDKQKWMCTSYIMIQLYNYFVCTLYWVFHCIFSINIFFLVDMAYINF